MSLCMCLSHQYPKFHLQALTIPSPLKPRSVLAECAHLGVSAQSTPPLAPSPSSVFQGPTIALTSQTSITAWIPHAAVCSLYITQRQPLPGTLQGCHVLPDDHQRVLLGEQYAGSMFVVSHIPSHAQRSSACSQDTCCGIRLFWRHPGSVCKCSNIWNQHSVTGRGTNCPV